MLQSFVKKSRGTETNRRCISISFHPLTNSTGEDDLENLHMGFMSFCENKVSKIIVWEYMIYVIIKYREPRFQVREADGRSVGWMVRQPVSRSAGQLVDGSVS